MIGLAVLTELLFDHQSFEPALPMFIARSPSSLIPSL